MSIYKPFLYAFGTTLGLLAATGVIAWTGPSVGAPGGNASAPLNVSGAGQTKVGGLVLNSGGAPTGLTVYGNVGIGTLSPATKLQVGATTDATANTLRIAVGNATDAVPVLSFFRSANIETVLAQNGGNFQFAINPAGYTSAAISAAAKLTVGNTGNVGIGTASPIKKLEVVTTHAVNIDDEIRIGSYYANNFYGIGLNYVINSAGSPSQSLVSYYAGTKTANVSLLSNGGINVGAGGYNLLGNPAMKNVNGADAYTLLLDGSARGAIYLGGTADSVNYYRNSYHYFQNIGGAANYAILSSIGLSVTGSVTASAFYYSSDERLKKNIETISNDKALADILALNPVTYNWKDATRGTATQLGFIAQEVEKVVPELVVTDASTTMKAVDYARVAPLLVGAIQAQQARLDAQQKQIDALMAELEQLKRAK